MTDVLSLSAELTIYTVADCHAQYLAWAAGPEPEAPGEDVLRVNAAAVEEVDAAGLQLLLSLANGLQRRRRRLHLVDASAALRTACELLGTRALLTDETATEAQA